MNESWEQHFGERFHALETLRSRPENCVAISLKVRVKGGCFHREHSPHAYKIIDTQLKLRELGKQGIVFEEHESGPELLTWIPVVVVTLGLVKELVGLLVVFLKARSEGIKKGDDPREPLEVIIRGYATDGQYKERRLVDVEPDKSLKQRELEKLVDEAILEMFTQTKP